MFLLMSVLNYPAIVINVLRSARGVDFLAQHICGRELDMTGMRHSASAEYAEPILGAHL